MSKITLYLRWWYYESYHPFNNSKIHLQNRLPLLEGKKFHWKSISFKSKQLRKSATPENGVLVISIKQLPFIHFAVISKLISLVNLIRILPIFKTMTQIVRKSSFTLILCNVSLIIGWTLLSRTDPLHVTDYGASQWVHVAIIGRHIVFAFSFFLFSFFDEANGIIFLSIGEYLLAQAGKRRLSSRSFKPFSNRP